jgi:hypothetical protein
MMPKSVKRFSGGIMLQVIGIDHGNDLDEFTQIITAIVAAGL